MQKIEVRYLVKHVAQDEAEEWIFPWVEFLAAFYEFLFYVRVVTQKLFHVLIVYIMVGKFGLRENEIF